MNNIFFHISFTGKVFAMRMMSDFKDEDILKQYFKIYMGDHPDEQVMQ